MTRYLITGAQGFVGRYLIAHLLTEQSDARIIGIGRSPRLRDRLTHTIHLGSVQIPAPLPGYLAAIEADPRYDYLSIDINNVEAMKSLLADFSPDIVIHLASGLRDDPPATLFRTNVEGTINLLNAIGGVAARPSKLVIGSTGGVYGVPAELPIHENQACVPNDVYSISKLAQEHAARVLCAPLNLRVAFARIFNVVGPGQDERHICGQLAARAAGILVDRLPAVVTHGPLHTTRDFVDVRDVARAIVMIAGPAAPAGLFNVGSGVESSMQEVLDTILELTGLHGRVGSESRKNRPNDVPRHVASIERLRSLGFQPAYTLRESLEDVVSYYVNSRERECEKKTAIACHEGPAGYRQKK
jgi:nucleoside-diphosphate-sugar epimerase